MEIVHPRLSSQPKAELSRNALWSPAAAQLLVQHFSPFSKVDGAHFAGFEIANLAFF